MEEAKLTPSEDRAPPIKVQYDVSPDSDMDPRDALERQAGSQDPCSQDHQQPQNPNQGTANLEGSKVLPGLSFVRKLWRIVEDDTLMSVRWNEDGDNVIIDKYLFQSEVLCRTGADKIFESDSLKTFIRLMNLYGFIKIRPNDSSVSSPGNKVMIYRNSSFQRDKPWLLENIKTRGNQMTSALPEASATPPKKIKLLTPKAHSLRIRHKDSTREANQKAQRKALNAWGTWPFKFWGLQSTNSAMGIQCPSESGGPSGEGTSRNAMLVPMATAQTDGTGVRPIRPSSYPLYDSVMCLYNTCYSLLMAALSVLSPSEKEEEGSSDYKSVFCEPVKDNENP